MIKNKVSYAFGISLTAIYLFFAVPPILAFCRDGSCYAIVLALLHQGIAIGIALELSELLLGLYLPSRDHPRADHVNRLSTQLAVLYLCCDDVLPEALRALRNIQNADVYILDDSRDPDIRGCIDRAGFSVVRRETREYFKAGNLNNWLWRYGERYKYFVVLDSDSFIKNEILWSLVAYAEHPQNHDVAVVQPGIEPKPGNSFQTHIASFTAARLRILARLHDRIGWTISHGHNCLHRTSAILQVGGFATEATCEDTATSLCLKARGWRLIFVDEISHDTEPAHALGYRKRTIRWARQTLEIIMAYRAKVSIGTTLLMTRHLLGYFLPATWILLFALIVNRFDLNLIDTWGAVTRSLMMEEGSRSCGFALYVYWAAFLSITGIRFWICIQNGVSLGILIRSTALCGAMMAFSAFHVVFGMLKSAVSGRAEFLPTGACGKETVRFFDLFLSMGATWFLYMFIVVRLVQNPGFLIVGLNIVWVSILVGTPFILAAFHIDKKGRYDASPSKT